MFKVNNKDTTEMLMTSLFLIRTNEAEIGEIQEQIKNNLRLGSSKPKYWNNDD